MRSAQVSSFQPFHSRWTWRTLDKGGELNRLKIFNEEASPSFERSIEAGVAQADAFAHQGSRMLMSKTNPTPEGDQFVSALSKITTVGMLAVAAVCLASCVASETPLVVGSKPVLGPQFDVVLYRDFVPGKGYDSQEVKYHWLDGNYVRNGAAPKQFVRLTAEPLGGADLLVQRSRADRADASSNLYDYWIARKITDGTYLFFPLNEHDLTSDERGKYCVKDRVEGFCVMNNHDALLASARATATKPIREPAIGILVDDGVQEGKSNSLDRRAQ